MGIGQLVSESRYSGAHIQHRGLLFPSTPTLPSPPWRAKVLTLGIAPVGGLGREFPDIILQEELVARDPLHRLQHVVLQRQASTDLPLLGRDTRRGERNSDRGSSHPLLFPRSQEILGALLQFPCPTLTWMSAMSSWKGGDFSDQAVMSSTALSKFFTYSPYILRKGASFWITSPMRGLRFLQEGTADRPLPQSVGQTVRDESEGSRWRTEVFPAATCYIPTPFPALQNSNVPTLQPAWAVHT